MPLNHALVICTRNRPESFLDLVKSLNNQTVLPTEIIVVDSSDDSRTQEIVETSKLFLSGIMKYISSTPGLTKQRNIGVRNAINNNDILHFVDDDTILRENYFEIIVKKFSVDSKIVGVGGAISNLPTHKCTLIKRLMLLDSNFEGRVLRSGVNVLNFKGDSDRSVDWLSGCSMSFRSELFNKIKFDESRTGSGVGEDVDFCLRAKLFGKLLWTPDTSVIHNQTPINRLKDSENKVATLNHRLRLAEDNLGGVKTHFVYYAFYLDLFWRLSRAVASLDRTSTINELRLWKSINDR